jgi:glyceraldehyde-3-phosphate dehydrogenase (NADP+)
MTTATRAKEYGYYLAGEWRTRGKPFEIRAPYDNSVFASGWLADEAAAEEAVQAAVRGFEVTRKLPVYERARILLALRDGIEARKDELAQTIAIEAGKPIRDAAAEVSRAILTVTTAAEETKRIHGEIIALDVVEAAKNKTGYIRRLPLGPILAISPFNFPLNLAMHKLAPALAAGNSVVLKPARKDPIVMLKVAEILSEIPDFPKEAVSVLTMSAELAEKLVSDDRFKLVTFTGSSPIGWHLKAIAGQKRVTLELGGNAGVIVDEDADLDYAVGRLRVGGFSYAGQSCISVQRIYVHRKVYDDFTRRFKVAVESLRVGDPLDPATDVGPMIEEREATDREAWVEEAVRQGARVLTGGKANGAFFAPTVILEAPRSTRVCSEEVFAPLVVVNPFDDFKAAVAEVNESRFGLQGAVFTNNLSHAMYAFDEMQVGGVVVNDISSFRVDPMPYGGVKASGTGREGLKYAIEEMTEMKLMVYSQV